MSVVYALFIKGTLPLKVPELADVEDFIKYVDKIPNSPFIYSSGAMDEKNKVFLIKLGDLHGRGFDNIHSHFWNSRFSLCPQNYLDYYTKRIGFVRVRSLDYLYNPKLDKVKESVIGKTTANLFLDLSCSDVLVNDLKVNNHSRVVKDILSVSIETLHGHGNLITNCSPLSPVRPNNEFRWDINCMSKVFSIFIKDAFPLSVPTFQEVNAFLLYVNEINNSRFTIDSAAMDKKNNVYLVKFNFRLISANDLHSCFFNSKFSVCSKEYTPYFLEKVGFDLITYPECLYVGNNQMKIDQLTEGHVIGTSIRNGSIFIFLHLNCHSGSFYSIGGINLNIKSYYVSKSIIDQNGKIENVDHSLFEPVIAENGFNWEENYLKDGEVIFPSLESKNFEDANLNLPQ
ncbi:uncharacterized protein [Lepeophtheirus salmonis]|uniref:uncharacterized protein n=1 Tax=Lepeophtheirus salmonis TaxID=72036 RepID=UPI001AE58B67|nr:uncharacterized protein LOC121128315 [Lepeophtheirus salmonis]XP_040579836.1 uncharacterized protein LOC121128315 [Lepeophtheirus salmonis]